MRDLCATDAQPHPLITQMFPWYLLPAAASQHGVRMIINSSVTRYASSVSPALSVSFFLDANFRAKPTLTTSHYPSRFSGSLYRYSLPWHCPHRWAGKAMTTILHSVSSCQRHCSHSGFLSYFLHLFFPRLPFQGFYYIAQASRK